MSGRKESHIELEYDRERLIQTTASVKRGLADAHLLIEEIEGIVWLAPDPEPIRRLGSELRTQIEAAAELESRVIKLSGGWTIDSDAVNAAVADGNRMRAALTEVRQRANNIEAQLGLQAEIDALDRRLTSGAQRLAKWDSERVARLQERAQSAKETVNEGIRASQPAGQSRAQVAELQQQLADFEDSVSNREQQDEARRQVIAAIEQACMKLGFTVEHGPVDDPNEPRRFDIKTGVYGVLAFEMSLDAVLRTDCPTIQPQICEDWVERFEEQMSRLGVGINFRYSEGGQPVRQGKASRGWGAGQQVAARRAESQT